MDNEDQEIIPEEMSYKRLIEVQKAQLPFFIKRIHMCYRKFMLPFLYLLSVSVRLT